MGLHYPFVYLKHNYDQKKGQESNCQFDSQPLKVNNCPRLLACKWRATYYWKALNKIYNFALDLILIKGLHKELWASKVHKSPNFKNFETPNSQLGSCGTKWHLGVGPVTKHREYYKGEGGGFPQV
jgi:hypothetical protein